MVSETPKKMFGVIIEKTGGTEVLQYKDDLPVPEPKKGEILIKNEVIGVNYIDTYFRTGLYQAPSFPYTLGREGGGIIAALGGGETYDLQEGQRVVYMGSAAYAEYSAVPSLHVFSIPDGISTETACAGILQGLTALTLIRESHHVKPGDWVLVHAAAGGVGLWLCQLLKAVGAHTVATASSDEKLELAKQFGAEVTVNYAKEDIVKTVNEVTNGKGVIAVFDGVGQDTFDISLECVARKGSLVSFGNASGAVPPVTIARLSPKVVKLSRPMLFGYLATREEAEHYASELWDFMLKDKLQVRIHDVYPLRDVARAHSDIEGRKTTGKLLLKP
ncbi:NAD(P)-binding protein [Patellaria atrata CBS 101060]|uniref:Probable quinone oxidoreductase n=1 Tax=Patellaria atrata CBS 101060 TaxID=1346257 RepID=A0A9P4VMR3_9PEZI|nr:NAD(P)-binding protein [Patellaria atrata CBS 101060]